jgi:hypothetical protein
MRHKSSIILSNSLHAISCVLLLACLQFISYKTLAQSDTTKKLKEVTVKATTVPKVQTLTPVQRF